MVDVARLQLGRIVWAEIADANGIRKLRPAVIVTPTDQITPTNILRLVAVTSRVPDSLPNDHVLIPWHVGGHPRTGLNRKCAAVCSWICEATVADIQDLGGVVPGSILLTILTRIAGHPSAPDG